MQQAIEELGVMDELNYALGHLVGADIKRAKKESCPDPDLVIYYIEHADWAVKEALELLGKEKEE